MKKRFLLAVLLCAACDTTPPAAVENVPLPGEWTLVAVNNSPVPFNFGGALCIRSEQMSVDEQGRYSRDQSYSVYTCQDPETLTLLTGQWTPVQAGYEFTQEQNRCSQPPAAATVTGNSLVVEWVAESPSRGSPCYAFTWKYTYQKM